MIDNGRKKEIIRGKQGGFLELREDVEFGNGEVGAIIGIHASNHEMKFIQH